MGADGRVAEPLGVAVSRRLREARLRRQCGWKWSYVGNDDTNGLAGGGGDAASPRTVLRVIR